MAITKVAKIWANGKLIDWDDAKIHVLAHVVNYGSSIFEGIRCYRTPKGPAVFRLPEHVERLFNSCKIYRFEVGFTREQISNAILEVIRVNKLDQCYVRPIVMRGYGDIGVNPFPAPIDVYIACYPWGKYLGEDALENGVDVCVSSWTRLAPNTLPALAKAGANYMNSQLIKMEALVNGYAEGIALTADGYVSEGSGENVFIVRDGDVFTPPLGSSVLPGITRSSVLKICKELQIQVHERQIPREALYIADEVFFAGTAVEITPIRSVDRIQVGQGRRGPVTAEIQKIFFDLVTGKAPDTNGWLTSVNQPSFVSA
ncbi:MAG: branched-chain amino acid transaminase [Acidobacteriia bacterium]|nr:branched-chain amino acid transaminase [Terriglobia bacterium]